MPAAASWLAPAGAAACCGAAAPPAVVVRAPAEAQPAANTSSAKAVDRCRMIALLLFHEFKHDRRAGRRDANEPPRRLLADVHHDRELHPRQLEPERGQVSRGDGDV